MEEPQNAIHVAIEISLDDNDLLPDVDVFDSCSICHRITTESHPVPLLPFRSDNAFNHRLSLRQFGDRTGMLGDLLVCNLYFQYVS